MTTNSNPEMLYSVGDRVHIVSAWTEPHKENPSGKMDKWLGELMTIREVEQSYYRMEEDRGEFCGDGWVWHPHMIAGLVDAPRTCQHCGCIIEDGEESHPIPGYGIICHDCAESDGFYACEDCGKLYYRDDLECVNDDMFVCRDCVYDGSKYFQCHECGEWYTIDHLDLTDTCRYDDGEDCVIAMWEWDAFTKEGAGLKFDRERAEVVEVLT